MGLEVSDRSEERNESGKGLTQEQVDALVQKKLDEALKGLSQQTVRQSPSSSPEDFASMISKGISDGMKSRSGQFVFDEGYTEEEIDLNDVLPEEEWVVFAVHKIYDIIVGDKRHGKQIRVPFEPIEFIIEATKIVKQGKESSVVNFATYVCKSKKELEWLKNHSQYNVRFFDSINGAASVDSNKASILSKNMNLLNSMNQHQIRRYATDYGVPFSSDLAIMRANIATKITEKEMGQFKNWQASTFEEQMKEAESIGRSDI